MTDDIRTRLLAALPESIGPAALRPPGPPLIPDGKTRRGYGDEIVDALLPIVKAIANQRAAEALEQAADTAHGHEWWEASGDLYARAVALRSEESA